MKKNHKPCPKCGCPKSKVLGYDGDYWRTCMYCGTTTRPFTTAKAATQFWDSDVVSPNEKEERIRQEAQKAQELRTLAVLKAKYGS